MKVYLVLGIIIVGLVSGIIFTGRMYFKADAQRALAVESFKTYAENAQSEAIENNAQLALLHNAYESARTTKHDNVNKLKGHNIDKIIEDHPRWFADLANDGYGRLFDHIEQASAATPTQSQPAAP